LNGAAVGGHAPLTTVLSLGYMPPVNQMVPIGEVPRQQPLFFPVGQRGGRLFPERQPPV
jgi:hypothetical protein